MKDVKGWEKESLGNQMQMIRNGYSGRQTDYITDFPVSRIETISDGTIDMDKVGYVDFIPGSYLLKPGDILFSNINSLKHIGKVAQVRDGTRLFHGMNLLLLRSVEQVDQKFLFYKIINAKPWFEKMAAQAINQASINQTTIKELQLDFPHQKHEQTKIAEILSTVDKGIEKTEALIAKQQRIKTGLMQDLLTRGIDEHGNLRSEKTHRFKDSPLGRIPVEWEVLKWNHVCSKIQYGTHFSPRTDSSEEFKYVTSKNIKFGHLDISDVEYIDKKQHDEIYKRCNVCLGDLLLTKDGANTGNGAINRLKEEFSLLSSVAIIRPMKNKLTAMFLLQTILSENGQRMIKDAMSGLAITRVTLDIINNFWIKVPPIKEQKNIGQILAVQDKQIELVGKKLAKLRSLKTALMQDLLTGRKRVTTLMDDMGVTN